MFQPSNIILTKTKTVSETDVWEKKTYCYWRIWYDKSMILFFWGMYLRQIASKKNRVIVFPVMGYTSCAQFVKNVSKWAQV